MTKGTGARPDAVESLLKPGNSCLLGQCLLLQRNE
jgi:hypothetical protein